MRKTIGCIAALLCAIGIAGEVAVAGQEAKPIDESGLQPGKIIKDCSDCPEMVIIPKGSFDMGSPASEVGRLYNEGPVHRVTVNAFAMGKTHITKGQFSAFVKATNYNAGSKCWVFNFKWRALDGANWRNPGYTQQDNHPVACINWNDANAYAKWLSRKTGKQYRLPNEVEWEYAARAGTTTARYWGDSPDLACRYANVGDQTTASQIFGWVDEVHNCSDGYAYTSPVASFEPNAFGLFDMQGNLWQLLADSYSNNYYGAPVDGSDWQEGGPKHVVRGGSWFNFPHSTRSAYRNEDDATLRYRRRYNMTGFRLAKTLP